MYLFYVDESGDTGHASGSSPYFVLSGLVVHELAWGQTLDSVIAFRKALKQKYGLLLKDEIHAGPMIHSPGKLARIQKSIRLRILREVIDFEAKLTDANIVNVVVNKTGKAANYDVFEMAWKALITRFHNTMSRKNFPGPQNPKDYGLVIVDRTHEGPLRRLTRKIRRFNPVPSMLGAGSLAVPTTTIAEDPVHRDSAHSYLVQLSDVNAYFLYQMYLANKYIRKQGARNYFQRLKPSLCLKATSKHPLGIVEL